MGENGTPAQLNQQTRTAVMELWRDGRRPFILLLEGSSMDPLALSGDRVTIQPVSAEELRCGDILAMHQGEAVVVHRIVRFRTGPDGVRWLCQKGDNSPAWSLVEPDSVLGRVSAIHAPDRTLRLWCRPWTWINPLAGRLGRLGIISHRLSRLLLVPLIRLGLWLSPS